MVLAKVAYVPVTVDERVAAWTAEVLPLVNDGAALSDPDDPPL
jgi:hypothetical protein